MSVDFTAILNTQATAVEAPKQLPAGTYKGVIKEFGTGVSDQKKTPYVEFTYALMTPVDVQPENIGAAQEALGKGPVDMSESYYLTDKSLYRLVEMLERVGIPRSGNSVGQMVQKATGRPVQVTIEYEPSKKDPTKSYAVVKAVSGS